MISDWRLIVWARARARAKQTWDLSRRLAQSEESARPGSGASNCSSRRNLPAGASLRRQVSRSEQRSKLARAKTSPSVAYLSIRQAACLLVDPPRSLLLSPFRSPFALRPSPFVLRSLGLSVASWRPSWRASRRLAKQPSLATPPTCSLRARSPNPRSMSPRRRRLHGKQASISLRARSPLPPPRRPVSLPATDQASRRAEAA